MTVKELKEFIEDIPDNAKVVLIRSQKEFPIVKYVKSTDLSGEINEELQII